jgi:hypothetical protein
MKGTGDVHMAKTRITIEIEIEETGKVPAGTKVPTRVFKPGGRAAFKDLLRLADLVERTGDYKEAEALRERAWLACTTESKRKSFTIWD